MVLFEKSKLNSVEVLISKALIDSVISHDEFALINNFLKEYKEMKEEIKNSNNKQVCFYVIKEILISEKQFTEINYKRSQEALVYIKNNLIDTDGGMYLTIDSLIETNNIITD